MDFLWSAISDWLKELLVSGILSNLSGMFDGVNEKVGDIAVQVGTSPEAWNGGIFNMVRSLSDTVVLPVAGLVLAFVMTLELVQILMDKNNFHDIETVVFFRWMFKTACAVLIVSNTWNIVMGVFDMAQSVVSASAGVIAGSASIDLATLIPDLESRLNDMELGALLGLCFQSLIVGVTMWALTVCVFIIVYGRMIEIYLVTSMAPGSDGGDDGAGVRKHGTELSPLPVRSGLSGVSYHGVRRHLRGSGAEYRRQRRCQRRDLDVRGLHRPALLHPLQNRKSRQEPVRGALRTDGFHTRAVPVARFAKRRPASNAFCKSTGNCAS